jgi:hypothetical protein
MRRHVKRQWLWAEHVKRTVAGSVSVAHGMRVLHLFVAEAAWLRDSVWRSFVAGDTVAISKSHGDKEWSTLGASHSGI